MGYEIDKGEEVPIEFLRLIKDAEEKLFLAMGESPPPFNGFKTGGASFSYYVPSILEDEINSRIQVKVEHQDAEKRGKIHARIRAQMQPHIHSIVKKEISTMLTL